MSKKKKPPNKRTTNDPIAQRYRSIANNIIAKIGDISPLQHLTVSLVKSTKTESSKISETRWDIALYKDDSRLREFPDSMDVDSFADRLGITLRNAGKDSFQYDLFVAFFKEDSDAARGNRSDRPSFVYQWLIQDKTISADIHLGDSWDSVSAIAGPVWTGSAFQLNDESGLNLENFSDEEIIETGTLVTQFVEGVMANASAGAHMLEAQAASHSKPVIMVFHKDDEGSINVEQGIDSKLAYMSTMVIQNGNFSATLRSFTNAELSDYAGLLRDDSTQEVRAWSVSLGDIYALNSKQIVDAYCRDFTTGEVAEKPENISYVGAWEIPLLDEKK